ncbi:MAG: hypothetical protein HGA24_06380 [Candidatus Aminicenantes bacterium]|jgi:hypothetical protein|nr:hypothetical protein [Candidatus Aminicenantes bacterium]
MSTLPRKVSAALFIILFAAAASLPAQLLPEKEIYKARMLTGRAPVEPALVEIRIEIEGWTTQEEIVRFQDLLIRSGTNPFLDAYGKSQKGVVRFMYARGWNLPIHAAQFTATEKGKKVRLFFLRQNWNPNYQFASTGRYLFMAIEFDIGEKNQGTGRLYEDASIKLDPDGGMIVMDSYASAPKMFPMVQLVVKKAKKKGGK